MQYRFINPEELTYDNAIKADRNPHPMAKPFHIQNHHWIHVEGEGILFAMLSAKIGSAVFAQGNPDRAVTEKLASAPLYRELLEDVHHDIRLIPSVWLPQHKDGRLVLPPNLR